MTISGMLYSKAESIHKLKEMVVLSRFQTPFQEHPNTFVDGRSLVQTEVESVVSNAYSSVKFSRFETAFASTIRPDLVIFPITAGSLLPRYPHF